jgi:hypothetical protein
VKKHAVVVLLALVVLAAGAEVAFDFIENHIYIPVTVAGKTRPWMLDTGAGGSVIDAAFARELGLARAEGEVMAMGSGGTVQASFVELPGLTVAGAELGARTMVALDIVRLTRNRVGTEPAGILGSDFLAHYVTRLDYADRTLEFYEPDVFEYRGEGKAVAMRLENNIPAVRLAVEDSIVGWWRLDTGASYPIFHGPTVAAFGLAERTGVEVLAGGVGGPSLARLVRFGKLELAGYTIHDPVIAVPLDSAQGALATSKFVGTLGVPVLRNFVLYLDYRGNRIIFEPGADFGKRFSNDRSGLTLGQTDSAGLRVLHVSPATPADSAGFRTDDEILAIDGRAPEEFGGVRGAKELLRAESGTAYVFSVRRDGADLKLELTLRNLFEN